MKWFFVTLCCMMIIPSMVYAQSDVGTMNIEQEQYTLERTGDVLVKIFGTVELERNSAKISLSHTSPSGEIVIHNVRTTDQGYYEPDTSSLPRLKVEQEYGYDSGMGEILTDKVNLLGSGA